MEKTSREPIRAMMRTIEQGPPDLKPLSPDVVEKVKAFLNHEQKFNNKMEAMAAVYEMLDLVVGDFAKSSICRKGCAWCCAIPVQVMPIEVEFILYKTGISLTESSDTKRKYCPMLNTKTAECTIYEARPINCRAFLAYDSPEYCKQGVAHYFNGGPSNGWGSPAIMQLAFQVVMMEMDVNEITLEMKEELEARIKDIREYF